MRLISFLIASAVLAGCGTRNPDHVFIAGKGYSQSVVARVEKSEVKVGQPLLLHATRKSGPFAKVEFKSLGASSGQWWLTEPPLDELEVSDNLTWQVMPDDQVKFNVGIRDDHARTATFQKAGKYVVQGVSVGWDGTRFSSNKLEINVVP